MAIYYIRASWRPRAAGVDLACNGAFKKFVGDRLSSRGEEPGVATLLGCGMASSTCAMTVTYPLNLVRKTRTRKTQACRTSAPFVALLFSRPSAL